MSEPTDDRDEIIRTIKLFVPEGDVTELRLLDVAVSRTYVASTVFGYFTSAERLADATLEFAASAQGCYFTPNEIHPGLLARAANRAKRGKTGDGTKDHEVLRRRWLLVDLDPVRPTGIPSSDEEHALAHETAIEVRDELTRRGWPAPVYADSGNGAHLCYRVALPANDGRVVELSLAALAERFDDERVKLDRTVHNPARIWKLYGTVARKGDTIPGRPRRLSRLLDVPDRLELVSL